VLGFWDPDVVPAVICFTGLTDPVYPRELEAKQAHGDGSCTRGEVARHHGVVVEWIADVRACLRGDTIGEPCVRQG
jgi:hypothetical protein